MTEAVSARLPDGSVPPTGDAAAVLGLFDPMGALSRRGIALQLARQTRAARSNEAIDTVITELVARRLLAPRERLAEPSLNRDDGPGGDDECFVTTPLGRKAARLCNWLSGSGGLVGMIASEGTQLEDVIVREVGERSAGFASIDAACCCADEVEVRRALQRLIDTGHVKEVTEDCFVLLPAGAARLPGLEEQYWAHLEGDLVAALGAAMTSAPPGEEGRSLRAAAFDARKFHPEVASTSQMLFADGHFAEAVFAMCKRIAHLVQARTSSTLDGDSLFATAFRPERALLKFNTMSTQDDRNEQHGMMLLFQGMWGAIRNPNAHRVLELDQVGALERLGFLSMLMRYLDTAST